MRGAQARLLALRGLTVRAALRIVAVLAVLAAGVLSAIALLRPAAGSAVRPGRLTSAVTRPLASMFQDDRYLIYSSTPTVIRTLDGLAALGVDQLRITVLWSAIAPAPGSPRRPAGFDAADPAAYPRPAWAPYDRVVKLARARGLAVNFDVTAPGPRWAMRPHAPAGEASHFRPATGDFGAFVTALGRRYSGAYVPPGGRGGGGAIDRVDFWSIWNEPNQPGWLAPQHVTVSGYRVAESARLYRGYVDVAFAALRRTGHGADTILIGELAPEGSESAGGSDPVAPIPFLDALYCVGGDRRPLSGAAAHALGCPERVDGSAFVAAHPGLFDPTGFAHHPYSFFLPPGTGMSDPNFVPLAELGRLERALDDIFASYAVPRRLPLYLTEYGYETNPPNPFRGVSPATQAAYLDQAAYMAWRDPRVRTLSQFELYDAPPDAAYPRGSVRYWSTFQTGLVFRHGALKPALLTYRLPIFVPRPDFAGGGRVTIWGMLRLAANRTRQRAQIQWRPDAGGGWRTIDVVTTDDPTGVLLVRLTPPGTGSVRLAWVPSTGPAAYSRPIAVRETGGS